MFWYLHVLKQQHAHFQSENNVANLNSKPSRGSAACSEVVGWLQSDRRLSELQLCSLEITLQHKQKSNEIAAEILCRCSITNLYNLQ